jgi:hypothetical protein
VSAAEHDLETLMVQYRAGLDAEIVLLRRLEQLAARQKDAASSGAMGDLAAAVDERDRVMASLVALEHELKPVRLTLHAHRAVLASLPGFEQLVERHREAAALVASISSTDRDSLAALQEAEHARRDAARMIEQSESTLAAYRRVVSPPLASATLVDRTG